MKRKAVLPLSVAALLGLGLVVATPVVASPINPDCSVYSGGGWLTGACNPNDPLADPTPSATPTPSPSATPTPSATSTPSPTATASPKPTTPPVKPVIKVKRIGGTSKYDTSALISKAHNQPGVKAVYIANGSNPVDALSVSPVAAGSGPILLVPAKGTLPVSIAKELQRLNPASVVVLGGESAVSASMMKQVVTAANR